MDKRHTTISRFLSYVLRHRPDEIGLVLDSAGWAEIDALLAASGAHGTAVSRDELDYVVAHNDKKRFAVSEDGRRIRASQGHSTRVELGYEPRTPPEVLYHGTATRYLEGIRKRGLVKGARHHVHLSSDEATARSVGRRHGRVVVLGVRAAEMARAGFAFYLSANGVWLTEAVPYEYVDEPVGERAE
jgi:putative RNA 2'-phosphotransferase